MSDQEYLRRAVDLCKASSEPISCACIIVQDDKVIAREFNSQRKDNIAVNHAEVKAVCQANRKIGERKLKGATAYCSCEPCAMCLTALSYARVERIVFYERMMDLCPDDPQSRLDAYEFVKGLNFVPKLEQLLI